MQWTDAFGILNLVTLAWRCDEEGGQENRKTRLLQVCEVAHIHPSSFSIRLSISSSSSSGSSSTYILAHIQAAGALIESVHRTLGQPRSVHYPMTPDQDSPTGYKGLRIGKVDARRISDPG